MLTRIHAALLTAVAACSLTCSDDAPSECVEIDTKLADPPSRLWCDGEYSPPPWNGQPVDKSLSVCLPAEPDGSCKLCPRAEVVDEVETKVQEIVEQRECDLEHWEFGCMRTVENGKLVSVGDDYCCYQVGLWGTGCKDAP